MKRLRSDYGMELRGSDGDSKSPKYKKKAKFDGLVQIITNKQCCIEARFHDNRYGVHRRKWGYEVYCSL